MATVLLHLLVADSVILQDGYPDSLVQFVTGLTFPPTVTMVKEL